MSWHNKFSNTLASALVVLLCFVSSLAWAATDNVMALEKRALRIGTTERTYHLYMPKNLPPDKALPLVLAFHGRGKEGTGAAFAQKTQFNVLAQKEGFMVAYPDGVEGKWLDGGLMNDPRYAKDVEFANAVIDDVAKCHPVDARRIYTTGFSNGAAFSYLLAIRLSHRIAAMASVGANMSRQFLNEMTPDKEPVSLLQFCGSNDAFCGRERLQFDYLISLKENLDAWIKHNGCASEDKTQTLLKTDNGGKLPPAKVWANGRKGTEVVLLWLDSATHGWPIPTGKDGTLDPTPLIWEFFKTHPKAPTTAIYSGDHHAPSFPPTRYLDEVFPKTAETRNLAFRTGTGSTGVPD
jgi:polyhydroxybutyrate depolymerase